MQTVGDRIRLKRKALKYSQRSLGEKIGVSGPAVSQWENDQTLPEENLWPKIAEVLETTVRHILYGETEGKEIKLWDSNVQSFNMPKKQLVPFITWVQAGSWNNEQQHNSGEYEYMLSMFDTGENGYVLQIEGESMMPRYQPKDLIFINPDLPPEVGRRVIVSCSDGTTFKELSQGDNGQLMLKALNPNWPQRYIALTADCHIIGVVVGSVRPE
jgi:SOS-response transcriptional repressor LexA